MVPDIALAASAREWPDRLHRFLLDHGGGRVVDRVLAADQAPKSIDVMLIDDVCSFLSPRMVSSLKQEGTEVIGVFDPDDGADAKRRLLECGISDVIESDAAPEEFLRKIDQTLAHRVDPSDFDPSGSGPVRIGVTGPSEGVGMTEVALSLATSLTSQVDTALVDLDPVWPSVAQRLGLPLHPNFRTVLDNALHDPGRIETGLHRHDDLVVVGGRADGAVGAAVGRHDMTLVLDSLSRFCEVAVVDAGSYGEVDPGVVREMDTLLVVGQATPIGVARLIRTAARILSADPGASVLVVVNMVPNKGFHRAEVSSELDRALNGIPVFSLPLDDRITDAAWDGKVRWSRQFRRAVQAMADVVVGSLQ